MKIHYCDTAYGASPPMDINPLILQANKYGKFLVFCSREGMVQRIKSTIKDSQYPFQDIDVFGWWEVDEKVYNKHLSKELLSLYTGVIIVGKDRTDPIFYPIMNRVLEIVEGY